MSEWQSLIERVRNLARQTTIAIVGKYVSLRDAYLSVAEALNHAGIAHDTEVNIRWINAEDVCSDNVADLLRGVDGVLVPGGFGDRGIDGKMEAIRYVRENRIPFLGICLGMQVACVEFARNVLHLEEAHTFEKSTRTHCTQ